MSEPMTFLRANRIWMSEFGQPGAYDRAKANFAQAEIDEALAERREAERRQAEFNAAIDVRVDARLRELGLLEAKA